VSDRPNIHVRLGALEFLFSHDKRLLGTLKTTGWLRLEPTTGLEPVTSSLPRKCSTTELGGR
jgi:hypothetical protein